MTIHSPNRCTTPGQPCLLLCVFLHVPARGVHRWVDISSMTQRLWRSHNLQSLFRATKCAEWNGCDFYEALNLRCHNCRTTTTLLKSETVVFLVFAISREAARGFEVGLWSTWTSSSVGVLLASESTQQNTCGLVTFKPLWISSVTWTFQRFQKTLNPTYIRRWLIYFSVE
jgi:hypothetical protein